MVEEKAVRDVNSLLGRRIISFPEIRLKETRVGSPGGTVCCSSPHSQPCSATCWLRVVFSHLESQRGCGTSLFWQLQTTTNTPKCLCFQETHHPSSICLFVVWWRWPYLTTCMWCNSTLKSEHSGELYGMCISQLQQ